MKTRIATSKDINAEKTFWLVKDIMTILEKNSSVDAFAALAYVTGYFYCEVIANMTPDEFFEEFKKAVNHQITIRKENNETTKT